MNRTNPRDGQPDGAPADLQARVVVLEIVSMTALALALDTSENADVERSRGIADLILETIRQRCDELEMTPEARKVASNYANELLTTALVSLYPGAR